MPLSLFLGGASDRLAREKEINEAKQIARELEQRKVRCVSVSSPWAQRMWLGVLGIFYEGWEELVPHHNRISRWKGS
jgi:hypothetical protein